MKQIKFLLGLVALLSLPLFYFTGCSDKSDVNSPNQMNFDSPQFALVDYSDIDNAIEEGTIDYPMTFNGVMSTYSFLNMGNGFTMGGAMMKGNLWLERFDFGKHLGLLFRRLNLTDAQIAKVLEISEESLNNYKKDAKSYGGKTNEQRIGIYGKRP